VSDLETVAAPRSPEARRTTRAVLAVVDPVSRLIDRLLGAGSPWAGLAPGRRVVLGWLLTRAAMLALLAVPQQTVINDVLYYLANVEPLGDGGDLALVLDEYPFPVIALLGLPWLVSGSSDLVYAVMFVALMLAVDAAFTWLLWHRNGGAQDAAVTLWLAAGPLMGPLAVTRFDLVPGVLAGAAVLIVAARPRTAAVLVAIGAALKLWPAILLPALAAPRETRWRVVGAAVVAGLVIVGVSVGIGGLDRLLSPLAWQGDRGLQIESIAALPLMVLWSVAHDPWVVDFTRFITSEVAGPGDRALITAATVATVAAVVFMAVLWVRAWLRGRSVDAETVGWLMLTSVGLLIVTNKVFSPQYLLWLSPIAIAMVAVAPRRDTGIRRFTVLLLLVGVLTQLIYPTFYLWISEIYWANPLGVALLAVRDVALIGFVVYTARRAWADTAAPARAIVDEPVSR
jgi:hypothetical protein